jgi:hypothetical protein
VGEDGCGDGKLSQALSVAANNTAPTTSDLPMVTPQSDRPSLQDDLYIY